MIRRGLTVIELLVVLAIISVSLALVLPGIQHSIQDARLSQCKNNLKQLGLALHNYHEVYNTFAPGWISRDGIPGTGARTGWQVGILPFVDQAPLFNQIDYNQTSPISADGKPLPVFQTPIVVYRCPADPTPVTNSLRGDYATSNYSGNYGHVAPPRLRPLGMSDFWPGAAEAPMKSRGLFARNSSVGIRFITDGTSNTILAGERSVTSGAGIWPGVTDNAHEDDALTDGSHRSRINAGWYSYSSRHGGGVNILMCDGAVRFVSDKIDSKPGPDLGTLQMLTCRDDGNAIGDF
jgi:prepilin-type processing-associated H-X9-DG protein/prepilin-type N-terminal cleavage/methylation domain-containing protein